LANIAFAERERELEARLAGSRLGYTVLELGHCSTPGIPIDAFYSPETLRPFRPALARMLVNEPLERVVDALNRLRPDVVRGYGIYLEALFRKIDASSIDVWLPKVIAFSSDAMTPEGMALIEERFGIPVLGRYGAIEALTRRNRGDSARRARGRQRRQVPDARAAS